MSVPFFLSGVEGGGEETGFNGDWSGLSVDWEGLLDPPRFRTTSVPSPPPCPSFVINSTTEHLVSPNLPFDIRWVSRGDSLWVRNSFRSFLVPFSLLLFHRSGSLTFAFQVSRTTSKRLESTRRGLRGLPSRKEWVWVFSTTFSERVDTGPRRKSSTGNSRWVAPTSSRDSCSVVVSVSSFAGWRHSSTSSSSGFNGWNRRTTHLTCSSSSPWPSRTSTSTTSTSRCRSRTSAPSVYDSRSWGSTCWFNCSTSTSVVSASESGGVHSSGQGTPSHLTEG